MKKKLAVYNQCLLKIHVPLMPSTPLGRGSSDSRGRIHLLVIAFTATSREGAGRCFIGQVRGH